MSLEIRGLSVTVGDRLVLRDVSLTVQHGELHVVMGPNGSGKSTLLASIMGLPYLKVVSGKIYFGGRDITDLPPYERARLGIALAHQNPPEVKGVKLRDVARFMLEKYRCEDSAMFSKLLRVDPLLERDLFLGFSGGEKKRAELFLSLLQSPKLAMLDEPDSGVDIESADSIAHVIDLLTRKGSSVILVTHTGLITNKLSRIDRVHILMEGRIVHSGSPDEVLPVVFKLGYRRGVEALRGGGIG
ncbi:ABC transporter ATP-binding protein [Desulfurococcus mucosus]|uniref:ABC transporter related protein n=1 Tax=Desulfurococcus mucosus (strain ATCC 35584 / DSM 2162 / JCM 9187 / O7/1) TaxID=765177 RepID=E8R932_DESM0|nr:ABC transporter ATP-binding protein [Desulfurococcus mucosus]ADV65008.1 ABC transporter related protein [Desulfurococcus mucosus DSM 2162]